MFLLFASISFAFRSKFALSLRPKSSLLASRVLQISYMVVIICGKMHDISSKLGSLPTKLSSGSVKLYAPLCKTGLQKFRPHLLCAGKLVFRNKCYGSTAFTLCRDKKHTVTMQELLRFFSRYRKCFDRRSKKHHGAVHE